MKTRAEYKKKITELKNNNIRLGLNNTEKLILKLWLIEKKDEEYISNELNMPLGKVKMMIHGTTEHGRDSIYRRLCIKNRKKVV